MAEPSGRDLLGEWRRLMDAVVSSAASLGGRAELPRQLLEPMQKQVELLQEVIERERRLQRQVAGLVLAPFDAVFDLLAESGQTLHSQAEALETAGRALEDTAALARRQAELFERTITALREPAELAKVVAGLERTPKKQSVRKTADHKPPKTKR
jgi:Mg2+ and Co2+ transporter CorA